MNTSRKVMTKTKSDKKTNAMYPYQTIEKHNQKVKNDKKDKKINIPMNKQNDQTIRPQPNNKTEQKSTKKMRDQMSNCDPQ